MPQEAVETQSFQMILGSKETLHFPPFPSDHDLKLPESLQALPSSSNSSTSPVFALRLSKYCKCLSNPGKDTEQRRMCQGCVGALDWRLPQNIKKDFLGHLQRHRCFFTAKQSALILPKLTYHSKPWFTLSHCLLQPQWAGFTDYGNTQQLNMSCKNLSRHWMLTHLEFSFSVVGSFAAKF